MRIYVASSWKNEHQPHVVALLEQAGHVVYDFRNPAPGEHGFSWSTIDPNWKAWTPEQFRKFYKSSLALKHFGLDFEGMQWCEVGLLVLPSGRDSHLELGWIGGSGRQTAIYMPEPQGDACLMYNLADSVLCSESDLITWAFEVRWL